MISLHSYRCKHCNQYIEVDTGDIPLPGTPYHSDVDHETFLRLRKLYRKSIVGGNVPSNEQIEETINSESIGIAIIEEIIRLVSLSRDGQYRFIDGTEKLHNLIYVASTEALAMNEAIEELEALMNNPKVSELAFQDFFERNSRLILNDEYKKAHSHITLAREEGLLIPDFLLEPLDQDSLCDILDLKLPTANIFILKKSRLRYSAAVMEACAQLREYSNYFDSKENRERIYSEYGLKAYKPKMIVIIGRRGGY